MISRADAEGAIADAIGTRKAERILPILERGQYLPEWMTDGDLESAVSLARDIAAQMAPDPHGQDPTGHGSLRWLEAVLARQRAIATLLADAASHDAVVAEFRRSIGAPFEWEQLESWIDAEVAADGVSGEEIVMAPPDTPVIEVRGGGEPTLAVALAEKHRREHIEFLVPGDPAVQRRAIAASSVLSRLRDIAGGLADAYGWNVAAAATWVITDVPPAVPLVQATERIANSNYGVADRIVLTIDPTTPAAMVAAMYRQARGPGGRVLKPKHSTLAAFVADRRGRRSREQMDAWNRAYPQWRYGHVSNFRRDARVATRRLLQKWR